MKIILLLLPLLLSGCWEKKGHQIFKSKNPFNSSSSSDIKKMDFKGFEARSCGRSCGFLQAKFVFKTDDGVDVQCDGEGEVINNLLFNVFKDFSSKDLQVQGDWVREGESISGLKVVSINGHSLGEYNLKCGINLEYYNKIEHLFKTTR